MHHFIHEALRESCTDSKVFKELWNAYLLDEFQGSYCAVLERAKLLLKIERDCCPITYNHYFNDNLQKEESKRLVHAVEKLRIDEPVSFYEAPKDEEVL